MEKKLFVARSLTNDVVDCSLFKHWTTLENLGSFLLCVLAIFQNLLNLVLMLQVIAAPPVGPAKKYN